MRHGRQCGPLVAIRTHQSDQEERGTHEVEESRRTGCCGPARSHRRSTRVRTEDKGTLKIGIDAAALGRRGRQRRSRPRTACCSPVQQANAAGGVQGYKLDTDVRDDVRAGAHDPNQGARTCTPSSPIHRSWPWSGRSTRAWRTRELPITNEAGLPQCSPSNTVRGPHRGRLREVPTGEPGQAELLPDGDQRRHPGGRAGAVRIQRPRQAQGISWSTTPRRSASASRQSSARSSFASAGRSSSATATTTRSNQDFSRLLTAAQGLGFDVRLLRWHAAHRWRPAAASRWARRACWTSRSSVLTASPISRPAATRGRFINLAGIENSGNVVRLRGRHARLCPTRTHFANRLHGCLRLRLQVPTARWPMPAPSCIIQALDKASAAGPIRRGTACVRRSAPTSSMAATVDTVLGPLTS